MGLWRGAPRVGAWQYSPPLSETEITCTGHAATGRGTWGFNRKIEAQRAVAAEKEAAAKGRH